jgi:hypothetical protein
MRTRGPLMTRFCLFMCGNMFKVVPCWFTGHGRAQMHALTSHACMMNRLPRLPRKSIGAAQGSTISMLTSAPCRSAVDRVAGANFLLLIENLYHSPQVWHRQLDDLADVRLRAVSGGCLEPALMICSWAVRTSGAIHAQDSITYRHTPTTDVLRQWTVPTVQSCVVISAMSKCSHDAHVCSICESSARPCELLVCHVRRWACGRCAVDITTGEAEKLYRF